MERRPRVRISDSIEYLPYRRRRRLNCSAAGWTVILCLGFSAFVYAVAQCVP